MRDLKYYVPGTALIAMALLILAVPEILIALVSASIIMLGVVVLYVGNLFRKSNSRYGTSDFWVRHHAPHGWRFAEEPILERWRREY
jgi:Tfp pilus assembly protein PilV